MSQIDVIEKLSATLGIRIRRATRPELFAAVHAAVGRLDTFGLGERLGVAGIDADDAAFEVDPDGNVTGLYFSDTLANDAIGDALDQLDALRFLGAVQLTPDLARRIARLPRLRSLAVEVGSEHAADVLAQLGTMPLESLLIVDTVDTLDITPLAALSSVASIAMMNVKRVVNLDVLAGCPTLRHLGLDASALGDRAAIERLTRLETLAIDGTPNPNDFAAVAALTKLRSLVAESAMLPLDFLGTLGELRVVHAKYEGDDLTPLGTLPHLEAISLDDTHIEELSSLAALPAVQRVRLRNGMLRDLSALAGHPRITFLDVSNNPIERVPDALAMPDLRHLELVAHAAHRLTDARFVASCPSLESLNLEKHRLTDLAFARELGNLRHLNVGENELTSVEPLATLPNLTTLNVNTNGVRSIAPLARTLTLTMLNALRNPLDDVAPLGNLARLEDLVLDRVGLTDLSFAKRLRNLYRLDVARNEITSLEPLLELPHLAHVDASGNQIRTLSRETIEGLRSLESLELRDNPIEGLDRELYSSFGGRDTVRALRDYFRGLARGSVRHDHAKLVLVGNGRVGKTSIVTRLLDDAFDERQPSTHGIQLRRWPLDGVAHERLGGRPLQVDVWDFGGQDIYHATHRLFMRTRALFLLVWDRETEQAAYSFDEFGERYENFPLAYWIDYIKALAGSPVIVVQNKVDDVAERQRKYGTELEDVYPPPNGIIDFLFVSARRPDSASGFDALVDDIRATLATLGSIGLELPAQWVSVRDRLAATERRHMSRAEFDALCAAEGMKGTESISLASFLHEVGVLFYQPREFGDRLILDQRWAIDAVYALFDRRGAAYRDLRAAGRNGLTLDILKRQVWRHFSEDEHALLLEFMQSCELCFEFSPGRFYVPQLLPDEKPSRVAVRWPTPAAHCLQITYQFLHRAIVDRFLVRAGRLGADDEPEIWKNGIVIYEPRSGGEALVEAFPHERRILVQARGSENGAFELLRMIRAEFEELHDAFPATVTVSADGGRRFVDLAQLRAHVAAGVPTILSTTGEAVDVEPLAPFLGAGTARLPKGILKPSAPARPAAGSGAEIFLSYAWGDPRETGESREAIVDRLHDRLVQLGHRVVRDKQDAGYRATIGDFMRRIGEGQLVVTVISDKYLKSPYCMYELLEIYRNGGFQERVFPIVLDDAKLYGMRDRLKYVRYWSDEKKAIEEEISAIGVGAFSAEGTFREYDRFYRTVFNYLDQLMTLLADWNALTPSLLEEQSFDRLVRAIDERLGAIAV